MAKGNKANLPVQFDEELAKRAAAYQSAAVAAATGGNMIQTRGGIFTYKGAPIAGNQFDAIVLAVAYENAYYTEGFDPDSPASPACFSLALADSPNAKHDMMLDDESEEPQGSEKNPGACTGCWANQFNSGTRDGRPSKGKACSERRRVALIPYGANFDADQAAALEIAFLRFPVMSVGSIDMFSKNAWDMHKTTTYGVIGNFSIVPDPKSQFKIVAQIKGAIKDRSLLAALHARAAEADQSIMFKFPKNSEREEAAPAQTRRPATRPAAKPAKKAAAKPAPKPTAKPAAAKPGKAAPATFGAPAGKSATRPLKF